MSKRSETLLKNFREQEDTINERLQHTIENDRKSKAVVQVVDGQGNPVAGAEVKVRLRDHDFKYGANLFMLDEFENEEKNAVYRDTFHKVFNLATLPFYWSDLEPEQGKPRFEKDAPKIYRRPAPDLCLDYCDETGVTPKVHCLNYDAWTPLWVPDDTESVKYYLEKRIAECAERYRRRIHGWEVTNELFCGQYDTYPQNRHATNFFYDRDVLEWSFGIARKYLPANELIINEASHCWTSLVNHYRGPYYMQIERALLKGASIDAVGMQFHMFFSAEQEEKSVVPYYNPAHLYEVMDLYNTLGLKQQITEITIPCYTDNEEDEQLQSDILEYLMKIWFSNPQMEAAIYWNLVDGYAAFAPQGDMKAGENYFRGGLMRFDMTPKPAMYMLQKLFGETWHTEASFGCDEDGWGAFRGFYGKYDVEITADGKKTKSEIHVTKNSRNRFRIVI
ncbi:MAG: endo-1,4-beta-xylanase [Eubacteriales bacterium]